jgi:glycosyltransferase involved in cell wall biosynthesis
MRVFIDLSFLGDGRITGIERFAIEIYKRLVNTEKIQYFCLLPKGYEDVNCNVSNIFIPFSNKILAHFLYPVFLLGRRPDIIFLPAFPASPVVFLVRLLNRNLKIFRVLHDVVPWTKSNTLPWKAKFYFRPMEEYWLSKYSKIFSVSEYSAGKIREVLNLDVNAVIYNGVSTAFEPCGVRKFSFPIRLLSVGTIEPRKNYSYLVDVLGKVLEVDDQAELVICGRKGWGFDELMKYVSTKSYKDKVKIHVDSSDAELSQFYSDSNVFLYSSFEEGFGIPLVEAMSKGIPVVAINGSAISEVVGDAGVLMDGYECDKWVSEIFRIVRDDNYSLYSANSIKRSLIFDWSTSVSVLEKEFLGD